MADFSFEVQEDYGRLSEKNSGWEKHLTRTQWGDNPAKYDIRDWSPNFEKMGKGVTFTDEELIALRDLLNQMEL